MEYGWGSDVSNSGVIKFNDKSPMPFGKYKGQSIGTVPADYLDYISGCDWIDDWLRVKKYIEDNRSAIDHELREQGLI